MNEKRGRLIFMVLGFNNSIGNTSNFLIVVPWTQVLTSKCSSMPDCLYKIVKYLVDTVEVSFVSEKKTLKFERNERKFIGYSGCLRKEFL